MIYLITCSVNNILSQMLFLSLKNQICYTEMMKILIIRTFPDILDIQSYNVQEIGLAKALIRKGHTCDIALYNGRGKDYTQTVLFDARENIDLSEEVPQVSSQHDESDTEHLGSLSFRIYWLKGTNIFKNGFLHSVKKLLPDYDVIQVAEYDQLASWGLYTHQIIPTVMYHGLYASTYTKGYNFKCSVFDKLFLWRRSVKHVVALSKSELAADFLRSKGFKKIQAVGVGIDDERFVNALFDKCNAKSITTANYESGEGKVNVSSDEIDKPFKLLYIGKLEDRRNSLWLLDLLSELTYNRNQNVQMTIIGRGDSDYQKAFDEKAKKYIDDGFLIYIPKATQDEMPGIYSKHDMFVFPSNYEIFGMVLLEAMYFGLPVISSYNGGSSTLIKDGVNGLVQRDFEIDNWADRIESYISKSIQNGELSLTNNDGDDSKTLINRLHQDLGTNAALTIREHFLWDKLVDSFIDAYQEAIDDYHKDE